MARKLNKYILLKAAGVDLEAPIVSDIAADIMIDTIGPVTVTAKFTDNVAVASSLYKIGEGGQWLDYDNGVTVTKNATIYFKAIDFVGNESATVGFEVTNILSAGPVITLTGDNTTPLRTSTLTASTTEGLDIFYSTDNVNWMKYERTITVTENAAYYFKATDADGNVGTAEYVFGNIYPAGSIPENLFGTSKQVSWGSTGAEKYLVHLWTTSYDHTHVKELFVTTSSTALDLYELPASTSEYPLYDWQVKENDGSFDTFLMNPVASVVPCIHIPTYEWQIGGFRTMDHWSPESVFVSSTDSAAPKVVQSVENGSDDFFFTSQSGTWDKYYYAQNVGSVNDWTGTNEVVLPCNKGRIQNLFFGSSDPNILFLTDLKNGDALFLDDVYTDLPEGVEEHMARLYRIREIHAGGGDDIVDMTSQQFEYTGDGQTIRGGDGNDVIWANKGNNFLFGDSGNDRIVGASGNDVIAGGEGNDSMHGGGGDDIFTFCENWGADTVEQLPDGFVTLWFESGSEANWNAGTQTYTDGENSVRVIGVANDRITLRFGGSDDSAAQYATYSDLSNRDAFKAYSSSWIFYARGIDYIISEPIITD